MHTHPWMTDELAQLQDSVRKIFEKEFAPHEARWAKQQKIDREYWQLAGKLGLLCCSIPQEYGGGGGTIAHELVLVAEQARALVTSLGNSVHSGILAHYILNYGSEAQKRRWLPKMASGEMIGAIAMTEPDAGSDLQNIRTRAAREGDEYVINGSKTFITNGYHANLICVVTKTNAAKRAKGVSLIMLETDALPGFRRGRLLEKIGLKGMDTAELFFEDVRVPVANLLGEQEGQGFSQLMQQLPQERMIIAVRALANMERALAETIRYVKERKVFGKALIEMQNTRYRLAECMTEVSVARAFVDDCIVKLVKGELENTTAAMAKWWCTQKACDIIDECLQFYGGYGYVLEYPIARMYADVRASKIYGGANEIMKELIARSFDR